MKYDEKVVLITGGSGGLGIAFGRAFLEKGSKVCLADIVEGKDVTELQKEFGKTKVLFSKCDVTQDKDFEDAFRNCEEILGPVNVLINNAGVIEEKNIEKTFSINVRGVIRGSELALKKMGKHNGGKGGHVINIGSIAGVFQFLYTPFYAASKGAVVQYSRSVGDDFHYSYSGVTVQCLCPTFVNTTLVSSKFDPNYKDFYNELTEQEFRTNGPKESILEPVQVAVGLLKLLEEGKKGAVMVIDCEKGSYYPELLIRS